MTRTRGTIARAYWRGWNEALRQLRYVFAEMPQHLPALTAKHHAALRCLDAVAGQLVVESDSLNCRTNAELAKRFGCSPRTIQNWRVEGAPLNASKGAMIRWLGARRYVPKATETRYHGQLDSARFRADSRRLLALGRQVLGRLRTRHPAR